MAIDATLPVLDAPALEPDQPRAGEWAVTALFATAAFVGAGLLFVVQPLVAKLILPSYGGSATVWSTSSLFFQVLLLAAYGYAHLSTSRLGRRWQPRAHLVVLLLPVLALPVAIPSDAAPSADASPVLWLLRTLALVIGLPFAVVATTGPLLQRWYSWSGHRRSEDPYFLFAASNLGSFGGLLAYPLLIEPHLDLATQRLWWSVGFVLFVLLTGACALSVRRSDPVAVREGDALPPAPRPTTRTVLLWTGLAFLPSALMLAVTSHISTDVAAIPLLWVVPLAIYLATFVFAFARTSRVPPRGMTRAAVAATLVVAVTSTAADLPVAPAIALNLVLLGLVGYAAHARLAAERPPTSHLTGYYLVVAAGGALGGLLNGLVAPMVFDRVLEYPLALIATPLLMVGLAGGRPGWLVRQVRANPARAAALLVNVAVLPTLLGVLVWSADGGAWLTAGLVVLAAVLGWWLSEVPRALLVGLVVLYAVQAVGDNRGVLEQTRTFFGSYQVVDRGEVRLLVHGTTSHGTQFLDDARRRVPTTYYSRQGPLGDAFAAGDRTDVAVVGLGAGTVAAYGVAGQQMTFFEIDPEIVRLARDPDLFTYVSDSAAEIDTVVGDGRLGLAAAEHGSFDMLVLDAFSSDSIPVHLLTEEAMATYADRLTADGLLMVHVSNRLFDLEPVLASAADSLGWAAAIGRGGSAGAGGSYTVWVALSPDHAVIEQLESRPGWRTLGDRRVRWTDDYSSILSVLR